MSVVIEQVLRPLSGRVWFCVECSLEISPVGGCAPPLHAFSWLHLARVLLASVTCKDWNGGGSFPNNALHYRVDGAFFAKFLRKFIGIFCKNLILRLHHRRIIGRKNCKNLCGKSCSVA